MTEIVEVITLVEENSVQVKTDTDGKVNYRLYGPDLAFKKEDFVADIENPAFGGVEGGAQPYLEQMGWS